MFNFIDDGSVRVNSTSVSLYLMLRDENGAPVTGKVYSDMVGSYIRQGATRQAITMATLAAVDSAYASGGFKEVDATNLPGLYRFDPPDAPWVHGVDHVSIGLALGVAASGVLTLTGQPLNTETVTIDTKVYTFQTTLTNVDGNVLIGASASASLDNLIAAITLGAGAGTTYAAATTLHPTVTAAAGAGDTMDATAKVKGTGGNTIATTETLTNGSWGAATLAGGGTTTTGLSPKSVNVKLTYDGLVRAFTPQALAAGTLTLDAAADAGDGAFLGKSFVVIYSDDATDLGAMFLAHTSYTGSTKVALGTWTRVPTGTVSTMVVMALADIGNVAALEATLGSLFTTALTEAYSTDGGTITVAQALYELVQRSQEIAISGTTMTIKKRDGTTTAYTLTLGDATNPTTATRAT